MHIAKKGLRVLGVAESYSGRRSSILAGVVMRKDLVIDGVACTGVTVGGMDATDAVIRLVRILGRSDINCLMISGCVIAWYNILSPDRIAEETGLPVIAVTYEASQGLEDDIGFHFPGDDERMDAYRRLGERLEYQLRTGYAVYLRTACCEPAEAEKITDAFTREGKVPEPLRVARLVARAVMRTAGDPGAPNG
ncbi:MAG: hypothetical protein APR53_05125 [Methanoculleus sp. SDB]|nr:MAG: hypothetical protein APR53_05125 [Methanoculleus sp. SDB]